MKDEGGGDPRSDEWLGRETGHNGEVFSFQFSDGKQTGCSDLSTFYVPLSRRVAAGGGSRSFLAMVGMPRFLGSAGGFW